MLFEKPPKRHPGKRPEERRPGEPVTLADIQKAAQKKDPLRYWIAPFRWGPKSPLRTTPGKAHSLDVHDRSVDGSSVWWQGGSDEALAGVLRVGIVD